MLAFSWEKQYFMKKKQASNIIWFYSSTWKKGICISQLTSFLKIKLVMSFPLFYEYLLINLLPFSLPASWVLMSVFCTDTVICKGWYIPIIGPFSWAMSTETRVPSVHQEGLQELSKKHVWNFCNLDLSQDKKKLIKVKEKLRDTHVEICPIL